MTGGSMPAAAGDAGGVPLPCYTFPVRPLLLALAFSLLLPAVLAADPAADADAALQAASDAYEAGDWEATVSWAEKALTLYGSAGNPGRQFDILEWLGLVEYYGAVYDSAASRFQKAADTARGMKRPDLVPAAQNNLGMVRYAQGRYDDAIALYSSARDAFLNLGDVKSAAGSLGGLGSVYLSSARYAEAEESYKQALDAFLRAGDREDAVNTRVNLGILYAAWGRFADARPLLDAGLEEARQLGLAQTEAYGRASLGSVNFAWGRYDLAEKAYLRALSLNKELGLWLNAVSVTASLGTVYQAWGRSDKALELYRASRAEAEEIGAPVQAVSAMYLIGSALQADHRYDEALSAFSDALERAQELGLEPSQLSIMEGLGTATLLKREPVSAEPWFMKALELARRLGQRNMEGRQLIHLGAVRAMAGMWEEALLLYEQALRIVRAEGLKDEEATALTNMGDAYMDARDWAKADELLLQAIAVKEQMRLTAAGKARMDYLAAQLSSYRRLVTERVLAGNAAGAFDASELMKARWLAEELGARGSAAGPGFTGITAARPGLGKSLLVVSYAGMDADSPVVLSASRDFVHAREIPEPSAAAVPGSAAVKPADQTRGFAIVRPPYVEPSTIGEMVTAYRAMLTLPDPAPDQRIARQRLGRALYDLVLGPIQGDLEGTDELLVIPDGILCSLPFEALVLPDGRWLVERFRVTYVPSLTVKALLAARSRAAGRQRTLLALGGALYGGASPGSAAVSAPTVPQVTTEQLGSLRIASEQLAAANRGTDEIYKALGLGQWDDLPGTREEVKAIGALIPNGAVITGAEASESRIKRMSRDGTLAGYSVLHFATHGIAVPEAPELSALVLSRNDGSEDGYLTMREIADLKLAADFVNLSACDTGMGRILGGEGVVGLSEAFLTAGAGSLSVSLWPVSDEGTRLFMTELYTAAARRGLSWAAAMTEVKRAFIREGRFREPLYWAAFVFYGG
jgi:CHAT domain-containing protein/tetratricopeptide (TPR) repeat protein